MQGIYKVKDMATSEEIEVPKAELASQLLELLQKLPVLHKPLGLTEERIQISKRLHNDLDQIT